MTDKEGTVEEITINDLPRPIVWKRVVTEQRTAEKFIVEKLRNTVSEANRKCKCEGDRIMREYMSKKGLSLDDMKNNAVMDVYPYGIQGDNASQVAFWYKDELIMSIKVNFGIPLSFGTKITSEVELKITKGDW